MTTLFELLTAFEPFAKEPPRRSMLVMRLISQALDPDLAIKRGSQTLDDELDSEGAPPKSLPVRSSPAETPEGLASEEERLARRSLEIQVLLATWDLSRRIEVVSIASDKVELHLGGRPPTPIAAPSPKELKEAIRDLLDFMKEHPIRLDEIVFEADGLDLAFPLVGPCGKFHTLLAMDVVTAVVSVPVHAIKHMLDVKRPSELDVRVSPLIPVPGHASYPGGHAATTFALATVLGAIMGVTEEQQTRLDCIARRISRNREKVGLHTRLDTNEGKRLGRLMGEWMVEVAGKSGQAWSVIFAQAAAEWRAGSVAASSTSPGGRNGPQDLQAESTALHVGSST
ncbi:MAG TPA: hypothetical protein VHQ87_10730 [Rhizobacter sp.]|jgi:hypothetical protein|nr:hypothetical protein [Rhizobacter sp.]